MEIRNLPRQMTTFIGRENEITTLTNLFEDDSCRLLTLTGLGGIGKSRLAIELVKKLNILFVDRIYYVPLQSLQHSNQITQSITTVLGIEVQSDPYNELLDYLHARQTLLIIDNCEHVLDGFTLVSDILKSAPNVKILATSREALNLDGEWLRQVHGLDYPKDAQDSMNDSYDAVQLFIERAKRLRIDINFSDRFPDIARVCQLLEGMPLALELAAGWVTTLTCHEIAEEIEQNQNILVRRLHDIPERHRSIQFVFDQSWHLLTDTEQSILRRFAVFRGGCTRSAAQQITGVSLSDLARFVEKSLLRHDPDRGRYDMQELLLQYTRERLKESDERNLLHELHGNYYASLCYAQESNTHGSGLMGLMTIIKTDIDNFRVAWAGALERKNYEIINQLTHGLWVYYSHHFHTFELGAMYKSAVDQLTNHSSNREEAILGRILARYGRWMATQGDIDSAESALRRSMVIAREQNDSAEYYYAMRDLAWYILAVCRGEYTAGLSMMEECVSYHREQNDQYFLALSLSQLAIVCELLGQLERQEVLMQESYQIYKAIDFHLGIDNVLYYLCYKAMNEGRWNDAQRFGLELVERGRNYEHNVNVYHTVRGKMRLMMIAVMRGDFSEAGKLAEIIKNTAKSSGSSNRGTELLYHSSLCRCLILDADGATDSAISLVENVINKSGYITDFARSLSWAQVIHAWVLCSLEKFELATTQVVKILSVGDDIYHAYRGYMMFAVVAGARIVAHQGQFERATEVLGFSFRHPNSPQAYFKRHSGMTNLLGYLKNQLGEEVFTRAWEREIGLDVAAIRKKLVRELSTDRQDDKVRANQSLTEPLTQRELEVLRLLAEKLSNIQIAERLFITVGTVKSYTNKIYSKLEVANRSEAVTRAHELRLI